MPRCRSESLDFIHRARVREVNTVDIDAPPEAVFSVLKDPDSWPRWFKAIDKVTWTSPLPLAEKATRTVRLGPLSVDEYFFLWEENQRYAFCFTKTNLPFVKALVEDYRLEPLANGRTRFTYTVAYDPGRLFGLTGPLGKAFLARTFRKGCAELGRYMKAFS